MKEEDPPDWSAMEEIQDFSIRLEKGKSLEKDLGKGQQQLQQAPAEGYAQAQAAALEHPLPAHPESEVKARLQPGLFLLRAPEKG